MNKKLMSSLAIIVALSTTCPTITYAANGTFTQQEFTTSFNKAKRSLNETDISTAFNIYVNLRSADSNTSKWDKYEEEFNKINEAKSLMDMITTAEKKCSLEDIESFEQSDKSSLPSDLRSTLTSKASSAKGTIRTKQSSIKSRINTFKSSKDTNQYNQVLSEINVLEDGIFKTECLSSLDELKGDLDNKLQDQYDRKLSYLYERARVSKSLSDKTALKKLIEECQMQTIKEDYRLKLVSVEEEEFTEIENLISKNSSVSTIESKIKNLVTNEVKSKSETSLYNFKNGIKTTADIDSIERLIKGSISDRKKALEKINQLPYDKREQCSNKLKDTEKEYVTKARDYASEVTDKPSLSKLKLLVDNVINPIDKANLDSIYKFMKEDIEEPDKQHYQTINIVNNNLNGSSPKYTIKLKSTKDNKIEKFELNNNSKLDIPIDVFNKACKKGYNMIIEGDAQIKSYKPSNKIPQIKQNFVTSFSAPKTTYEDATDYSIDIMNTHVPNKIYGAVITTSLDFPDALSASILSSRLGVPVLLTDNSEASNKKLVQAIKSKMDINGCVYILGGEGVISKSVENELGATRVFGSNRYDTNMKVMELCDYTKESPFIICSGENYADAIAAASGVGHKNARLLLVNSDITNEQEKYIKDSGVSQCFVIGGESAVGRDTTDKLSKFMSVIRCGGQDRYETSAKTIASLSGFISTIKVTGQDYIPALVLAPYTLQSNTVIQLKD